MRYSGLHRVGRDAGRGCLGGARIGTRRTKASTGRAMFFSVSGPMASKWSRPSRTWSRTARVTQMPPAGHSACSLAAMSTPSP